MNPPNFIWFLVAIALVLAILWLVGVKVDVVTLAPIRAYGDGWCVKC